MTHDHQAQGIEVAKSREIGCAEGVQRAPTALNAGHWAALRGIKGAKGAVRSGCFTVGLSQIYRYC